jgi:hypothetical protein
VTDSPLDRDGIAFDDPDADRGAGVDFSKLQRQNGACGCGFAADNPELVVVSVLHDDVAQHAQLTTRGPPDVESRMTSSTKHRHLNASVFPDPQSHTGTGEAKRVPGGRSHEHPCSMRVSVGLARTTTM